MKVCDPTKKPVKTLLLNDESPYIQPQNRKLFSCFFPQTFCSKSFSTAPLTLGFSQLISVGQKSSVTNSGVKRVIFETFTFYFAQTYSSKGYYYYEYIFFNILINIPYRGRMIPIYSFESSTYLYL